MLSFYRIVPSVNNTIGGGKQGEGHPDLVPNSLELRLRTSRQRQQAPDPAAVRVAGGGGQDGRQLQPRRLGQHHRRHRGSCPVREGDQGNAGRQLHHEQRDGDVGNPDERFLLAEGNHPQPTPAHLSHRR